MRGSKSNFLLLILIFTSTIALSSTYYFRFNVVSEVSFRLTIRVVYENRSPYETWFLNENDIAIGLFMNNSWQMVHLVSLSHSINKSYIDSDGNPAVLLNIRETKVPPGGRLSYNVTYRLIPKERKLPVILEEESGELDDIPQELKERFCKPTSLWNFNMGNLSKIAQEIIGGEKKVLVILKRLISWIANNIHYATSDLPRYPNETFSQQMGDCDDQANLLITLCRAAGIPAFLQVGCIYIPWLYSCSSYWSGRLLVKEIRVGWHGWAMVYVPPWGWLPVDLTYVNADLRQDPMSAIIRSAIIQHYTFQYANITITDYVYETRSTKEFLESKEFYIYEENIMEMEFETKVTYPRPPIIRPVYPTTLTLRLVGISILRRANNLYALIVN